MDPLPHPSHPAGNGNRAAGPDRRPDTPRSGLAASGPWRGVPAGPGHPAAGGGRGRGHRPAAPMRCRPPRCTPWGSRPATAGGRPPPSRWWPTGRPSTACSGSSAAPAAAPKGPATAGCWSAAAPLASIGGNVAHAQPDLVAQAIAAAIPLAVLAMLEGLKGDAGEVTRLTAQAADPRPRGRARPARPAPPGHDRPTHRHHGPPGHRGARRIGSRRPALPAGPSPTDRTHGRGAAAGGLCPAAAGRPALDGPHPGRGRRLWPQQRRQLPATPAPTSCGAHPMSRPSCCCATPPSAMPPAASRSCPCTTHSPTTAASSPSPTTDSCRAPRWATGCSCRDPDCGQVGKHPLGSLVPHGVKEATTNRARVLAWWTRHPQANIGLATGHRFDVLDVDGPTGAQAIRDLRRPSMPWQSSGPLVRTGGGGWHYYLAPTGLGNVRPRDLEQVDWRGRGGYVVAPPSRHASGHPYQWVAGRDLDTPLGPGASCRCWSGCSIARPTDPPRSVAAPDRRRPRTTLWAGGTRPGAGPGRHRPQGPAQPAAVGSPPATSTTWSPPAPSTTTRSTRACCRPPNAAACSPTSPARPTAPWPPAARSAWPTPARPPTAPSPDPTHASPPPPARAGGERTQEGR